MNPIEFHHIWKKFQRGEKFNSLRDSIPNLIRTLSKKGITNGTLKEKEFWALKDVSFTMKPGDVVGFIGPNGAGKSTILKLLSRIMHPTQGTMKIQGRLSALIEVTAGFHPELTGRENIYLNGTILGMKRREIDERLEQIVEFSGLREFIDTPIKRYSSGMYSRLGFSVAAHIHPDVLLVDEVLAVGDLAFQSKCAQKMRELLKSGTTILLVSHNMELIQSLCQRVFLLNKGEILKEGPADEIIPSYENLVLHEHEEELRRTISKSEKVKVATQEPIEILNSLLHKGDGKATDSFQFDDSLFIHVEFLAKETIPTPIFSIEIVRRDGVICCGSHTREMGITTDSLQGRGSVDVQLLDSPLSPGIYLVRFGIWDKDLMHPFLIRKKDIFQVEANLNEKFTEVVFRPKTQWKIQHKERETLAFKHIHPDPKGSSCY